MLQKNRRFIVFLNMLLETGIIFLSYQLSIFIRFTLLNGLPNNAVKEDPATQWIILAYSVCCVCLFYLFHLYVPMHRITLTEEISRLVLLSAVEVLTLGTVLYVFRLGEFSRLALVLFGVISVCLLCLKRVFSRELAKKRFQMGLGQQRVILAGCGELALEYWKDINSNPQFGYRVIGYIGNDPYVGLGTYLGSLNQIEEILETVECDEIVVALEPEYSAYIQILLDIGGREGLRVSMIPFYRSYYPSHPTIETVGGSILIDMRATPLDNIALAALKRGFDIFGSALLLVLLSPLMLATAVMVKLSSPGPIFFCQQRVGLHKKEFTMLKFRSMRLNSQSETAWSGKTDPRRTRFGCFIRKYSIDELPQLINVLKGDMSLVGPRPEVPFYVHQFKESVPLYLVRQQVRPGMTGWAQVHGLRGDTSIEARVKYDIWYIENWSPALDARILLLTLLGGFINSESLGEEAEESDEMFV